MAFKTLDLRCISWITVVFLSHCVFVQSVAVTTHVARAIPFSDKSLTGTPILTYTGVSKLRCIVECTRINCSSFNFGDGICELLETYLCEQTETLVARTNFKHYDVESGIWAQDADTYRQTTPCTTLGKCSPKCHPTTTPAPPTLPPPGPGEVNYPCSTNSDCSVTTNSDCRNGIVCECIAGYSHNPTTKTCDNGCTTFGSTYSRTANYELSGAQLWQNTSLSLTECEQECDRHTFCKAFTWNLFSDACFIFNVSKFDVIGTWNNNGEMQYWQRNCAG